MTMKAKHSIIPATLLALALIGLVLFTLPSTSAGSAAQEQAPAAAADAVARDRRRFDVTITNLTRGQQFTPILVVSHREQVKLFELGEPASEQLAILAEEGNTAPLAALLTANPAVRDVETGSGLTDPGKSVTLTIDASGAFNHLSVASMLIPTNDAFFAINGVAAPRGNAELTLFSPAYDSGSERNDELCASIPGPLFRECNNGPGGGGAPTGGEEGFVHIQAGIHGIGNFMPARRDWRNPVARITIHRVR